jgi:hypothetical protein
MFKVWFKDRTFTVEYEKLMHNATISARAKRLKKYESTIIHMIEDEQGNFYHIDETIKFTKV